MSRSGWIAILSVMALGGLLLPNSAQAAQPQYVPPAEAVPQGTAPGAHSRLLSDVQGRRTYALILSPGDEVFTALTNFARAKKLRAAHFTGIGAAHDVKLGWFDPSRKAYRVIDLPGQYEVGSLIGDVGLVDGNPVAHAHLVLGLPDGTTRAGHLLRAVTSPAMEIFVTEEPTTLNKTVQPSTGLSLFDLGR